MKRKVNIGIKAIFYGSAVAIGVMQIVLSFNFKIHFSDYLKRAADANTVELAQESLTTAIRYLEDNEMTSGNTSLFMDQPQNDVGYFYTNLQQSSAELAKETDSTSLMEKSNVLMKLRETLMDHAEGGDEITMPEGLYKFPHNWGYMLLNICAGVFLVIGFFIHIPKK